MLSEDLALRREVILTTQHGCAHLNCPCFVGLELSGVDIFVHFLVVFCLLWMRLQVFVPLMGSFRAQAGSRNAAKKRKKKK